MKLRDKLWLAGKSISGSRSTIRTIIAMALSLLLIMPVLWLTFAFYGDAQTKINISGYNNVYTIDYSGEGQRLRRMENGLGLNIMFYDENSALQLLEDYSDDITGRADSFMVALQRGESALTAGGEEYLSSKTNYLKIFRTQTLFPEGLEKAVSLLNGKGVFASGGAFTDGRQVIVSQKWLNSFGAGELTAGDKISLAVTSEPTVYSATTVYPYSYALDNDADPSNTHRNALPQTCAKEEFSGGTAEIFSDYTIAGVISDEYYNSEWGTLFDGDIWLQEQSLTINGESTLPKVTNSRLYDGSKYYEARIITYSETDIPYLSQKVTESGAVFPFFIEGGFVSPWTLKSDSGAYNGRKAYSAQPIVESALQLRDFSQVKRLYSGFSRYFGQMLYDQPLTNIRGLPVTYAAYDALQLSRQYDSVLTVLYALGTVILIASLLEYYNILSFNAKAHARNYGIMRAMGTKRGEYASLYCLELLLTVLLAFVPAAVAGFFVSMGISLGAQKTSFIANITLNLAYFPLAALCALVFVLLCSFIMLGVSQLRYRRLTAVQSLKMRESGALRP